MQNGELFVLQFHNLEQQQIPVYMASYSHSGIFRKNVRRWSIFYTHCLDTESDGLNYFSICLWATKGKRCIKSEIFSPYSCSACRNIKNRYLPTAICRRNNCITFKSTSSQHKTEWKTGLLSMDFANKWWWSFLQPTKIKEKLHHLNCHPPSTWLSIW